MISSAELAVHVGAEKLDELFEMEDGALSAESALWQMEQLLQQREQELAEAAPAAVATLDADPRTLATGIALHDTLLQLVDQARRELANRRLAATKARGAVNRLKEGYQRAIAELATMDREDEQRLKRRRELDARLGR
jgi:hypothetical protein